MKVALVHEMLLKLGGAERVVKTLSEMFHQAPIHTLLYDPKIAKKGFPEAKIIPSGLQKKFKWLPRAKFWLSKMPTAAENIKPNADIIISSSSAFAHGIKKGKARHICYCHSPMRYAWDYAHEYTKKMHPFMQFLAARLLSPIRIWDYKRAQDIDVIIANSKHVQKRIQKYWRRDSTVIYPPVNVKRFTPRSAHDDFFLIVSALTPFKRIDLAIEVFNKIKKRLVIIGEGAQKKELQSMAGPTIEFLGRLDDKETQKYFENCRAFIFPGEEDFGITPVEAMAAGKPVLAYGLGGVTESVQAGISGEFFYEPSPASLEDGLARLLANEKNYDPQRIRKIAEQFDEAVFKEKILELVSGK
jgi:glycosyltransferase involved in cell wall biosynthesis